MIHATAIIEEGAKIGDNVSIGAYCVIGKNVEIGAGCVLHSHVVVDGYTSIGEECQIFPFASIGTVPQDLKYAGEKSRLIIGKRNKIREHVTMNPGTKDDKMETRIGDDCLFMMGSHIAHDCIVGNNIILANNATLAGHVTLGDHVIIGGLSAVRQFARIGQGAIIGGMTGVENDVIPYGLVMGERGSLAGLNLVGLQRSGLDSSQINDLRAAFKELFESNDGVLSERLAKVANDYQENDLVKDIVSFIQNKTKLAICQPKKANG